MRDGSDFPGGSGNDSRARTSETKNTLLPRADKRCYLGRLATVEAPPPDLVTEPEVFRTEPADPELERIVAEEQACLERVLEHLRARKGRPSERPPVDYDAELLSLRDQIATARLEDVPPLDRADGAPAEPRGPAPRGRRGSGRRAVAVLRPPRASGGRSAARGVDRPRHLPRHQSGVRIVDWRDAPVSRLYYRYDEGDEYDETFGEREIHGEMVTRRSVTIIDGVLRRIDVAAGHLRARRERQMAADGSDVGEASPAARAAPRAPSATTTRASSASAARSSAKTST